MVMVMIIDLVRIDDRILHHSTTIVQEERVDGCLIRVELTVSVAPRPITANQ